MPYRRLLLVASLAAGAAGCRTAPRGELPGYNAILVSIDTLRPDHLGCYGYPRPTSPSIDALRADAVLFREAIAHAPSTLPSHASLLTSLLPQHHGASFSRRQALPDQVLTLAEVLAAHGYETVSFNGGGQLSAEFGLDQGFASYASLRHDTFYREVRRVLEWLGGGRPRPFFLFLHTYDVHATYAPGVEYLRLFEESYDGPLPPTIDQAQLDRINRGEIPIDEADRQHIVDLYDAGIRRTDDALGFLVARLKELGLYDRTLIVLTSDHGEELGEHGQVGVHSHTLYDELLRVPLLIKPAGGAPARPTFSAPVRLIDVAPTMVRALGIPVPEEFDGEDLLGRADARHAMPPAISWRDLPGPASETSIRTVRWKRYGGRLFDLTADPGETRDVAAAHPRVMVRLEREEARILAMRSAPPAVTAIPPAEVAEQLRSLGYVQ